MRKKIFSLFLASVLLLSMTACGGSGNDAAAGKSGEVQTAEDAGQGMKIAIVSSLAGVDDHSFNEDKYNGILAFI